MWYFTEFCKKENYSQFIFCLPFHYILDHPAYFKRNWNFQQLRSIPGYLAFLTSRNRFVSLPFFFFFPPRSRNHCTPRRTRRTILHARNHIKRLFSLFFLRNFIGKSVSDLDEWKLFRLAYIYIRSYFLHDRKSNLILIYWFHEWMNMEINMHASNRSFAHLTWKLS